MQNAGGTFERMVHVDRSVAIATAYFGSEAIAVAVVLKGNGADSATACALD